MGFLGSSAGPCQEVIDVLPFDYVKPVTLLEASQLLLEGHGRARPMAGATDLLIRIERGFLSSEVVVDVKALPGFGDLLVIRNGWLRIGAAVTMNRVASHETVLREYPLLAEACSTVASYQLRNRATLGGNICNASPAADSAPALICYGAEAVLYGPSGTRRLLVEDFFLGPGQSALQPGELLTAVELPPPPAAAVGRFLKLGRTTVGDISVMNVAVLGWPDEDMPSGSQWRVVLGSVAPIPLRAGEAERLLAQDTSPQGLGAASRAAAAAASPIDDVRASAAYRTDMVRVFTRRGVEQVVAKLADGR
jgi:carbon-monoxide dehydrogenase medium subunit